MYINTFYWQWKLRYCKYKTDSMFKKWMVDLSLLVPTTTPPPHHSLPYKIYVSVVTLRTSIVTSWWHSTIKSYWHKTMIYIPNLIMNVKKIRPINGEQTTELRVPRQAVRGLKQARLITVGIYSPYDTDSLKFHSMQHYSELL